MIIVAFLGNRGLLLLDIKLSLASPDDLAWL